MTLWYYADAAGLQQGPIDADELRQRHAQGQLQASTLVWREGLADWQPLASLAPELVPDLGPVALEPALAADTSMASPADPAWTDPAVPAAVIAPARLTGAADVVYAGFWRRFAASVIDSFLIGLAALPITLPAGIAMGVFDSSRLGNESALAAVLLFQLAIQVFSLVVTVTYFSGFHASRFMASPGKLAVGIKVVRSDGTRLSLGRSVGRGFAYYLNILTLYIGFLMAAFTQRKQGLHDLICDTLVVDRWAFTDTPERQRRGLDTVTMVILVLYGLLVLALLGLLAVALVVGLAAGSH
ncbi:MAG TPA: RDD family protein [Stenotrophomonas sp.]|jgi:uncharacterized RDD family membrane protein YckC